MSEPRVTDAQAATFAAYDESDAATVWYRADPKLLEQSQSQDSRADEFAWMRDLALDLQDARRERDEARVELYAWRAADDYELFEAVGDEGAVHLQVFRELWRKAARRVRP